MESESKHFVTCIKRASSAFTGLADAQDDCKVRVDAEIDNLSTMCGRRISPAEKNNIKKLAKALAADKADSFKTEAKSLAKIVGDFFNEPVPEEMV